mgnify:CR=1 FL=1
MLKAEDIRRKIEDLESKKRDVDAVISELSFGYALEVLQNASEKLEEELNALLNMRFEPKPYPVKLNTDNEITLSVGQTHQLVVTALLSDGSVADITKEFKPYISYKDYDNIFNNSGFMLSVSIDEEIYTLDNNKFFVKKTTKGWDVSDENKNHGLFVDTEVIDSVSTHVIKDHEGNPIGIQFVTDGNEEVGDDWTFEVRILRTGTTYIIRDPDIAEIDQNGLITGLSEGDTILEIYHNEILRKEIPVTVEAI